MNDYDDNEGDILSDEEFLDEPLKSVIPPGRTQEFNAAIPVSFRQDSGNVAVCEGCRHSFSLSEKQNMIVYTVKATQRNFLFHNETCIV